MKLAKPPANLLLQSFRYWMEERQRIYLRRQRGQPWPWTKNAILQRYRFTNCYRQQDRVTTWLHDYWYRPNADNPKLWFACAVARQINFPDTLAEIGFPNTWNAERVYKIMAARKARGERVYTSAYHLGTNHPDKIDYTVNRVLDNLYRKADPKHFRGSLESAHRYLSRFYGFGNTGFVSYEVITDLRHTQYLHDAPDIDTWTNAGPGCVRGLNRLFDRRLEAQPNQELLLREMQWLLAWMRKHRDPKILPTLEIRDIEMSLCEFDKYQRAKHAIATGTTHKLGLRLYAPKIRNIFGEEISLPRRKTG